MGRLKEAANNLLMRAEIALLSDRYFPLHNRLGKLRRLSLLLRYCLFRVRPSLASPEHEVIFVIYSRACERMLLPLIVNLLQRVGSENLRVSARVIVIEEIYQVRLKPTDVGNLLSLGCIVEPDHLSLIKASHCPTGKLVVLCLDQRKVYRYHNCGVDIADRLRRFSVKTISMQHGGTGDNCMEELASSASDTIMVWGERTYDELTRRHLVDPGRVRIVGNPLHDRLGHVDRSKVFNALDNRFHQLRDRIGSKSIALLATRLHSDYRGFDNEQQMYDDYMRHLYSSLDAAKIFLIIKMHPHDTVSPNLYLESVLNDEVRNSLLIVEPDDRDFDVYSLLSVCDFVITRASTVGEEALLLGKKVIAFDLLRDGPSKHYKHLANYGDYSIVYATPERDLRDVLTLTTRAKPSASRHPTEAVVNDLTYRLDGQSAHRAVNEILKQLLAPSTHQDLLY